MGFLDTSYNLEGMAATDEDLQRVRAHWQRILTKTNPEWLGEPRGPLGKRWRSRYPQDAVYIIQLTIAIGTLWERCIPESREKLAKKIAQLFEQIDNIQFEELVTEMIFGADLGSRAGLIDIEPLVSARQKDGTVPPSPDFAINLADQEIMFEVTVFHMERLRQWEAAVNDIKIRLEQMLTGRSLLRHIDITAPLELRPAQVSASDLNQLVQRMETSEHGAHAMSAGSTTLQFQWQTISVIESGGESLMVLPNGSRLAVLGQIQAAISNTRVLLPPEDYAELFMKSLRNTLKEKRRRQLRCPLPNILVLRPGQERVKNNHLTDAIIERIFPNPMYSWLSAVAVLDISFAGNIGFKRSLEIVLNPRADHPVPAEALKELVGKP